MRIAVVDYQTTCGGIVKLRGADRKLLNLVALGLVATLVFPPRIVEAQRLGRLFSTSDERALLDELRRERQIVAPEQQAVVEIVSDTPSVEQVTINGVVLRSRGVNSAWINGRPVDAGGRTREGVRVDTSATRGGGVKITLPSGAETINLKPGQKIDVDSGVVVEAYERASRAHAYTVFDRVSTDKGNSSEPGVDAAPTENASVQTQGSPTGADGVQYPEALLERIRRALEGNKP
jgi:hypothetical protein